ncbi:MAG: N-acetyl-gamma-glutamyl-phosphate reductase [Bacteroidales bacterium]
MIKIGIIGGAGYTAGELIRLLINHPDAEIMFIHSTSNAGKKISQVHSGLIGETDLEFCSSFDLDTIDLLFFCTPHGESRKFMESHTIPSELKIIDLSNDFRLVEEGNEFVYGLPELNRKFLNRGKYVANPGCFATAIQLALLPLAKNLLLNNEIHITAITGSTGAGQGLSSTSHFSWRTDNISVYKPFTHQHLAEIHQSLKSLQTSFNSSINFIPVRGDFARGIFASIYIDCSLDLPEIEKLYDDYYEDHSFTFISKENIDLKQVVNTNKCLIHLEKHGNKLLILSAIDNLLKGASGQAIHNMNLLFGLQEKVGLHLKPSAF